MSITQRSYIFIIILIHEIHEGSTDDTKSITLSVYRASSAGCSIYVALYPINFTPMKCCISMSLPLLLVVYVYYLAIYFLCFIVYFKTLILNVSDCSTFQVGLLWLSSLYPPC